MGLLEKIKANYRQPASLTDAPQPKVKLDLSDTDSSIQNMLKKTFYERAFEETELGWDNSGLVLALFHTILHDMGDKARSRRLGIEVVTFKDHDWIHSNFVNPKGIFDSHLFRVDDYEEGEWSASVQMYRPDGLFRKIVAHLDDLPFPMEDYLVIEHSNEPVNHLAWGVSGQPHDFRRFGPFTTGSFVASETEEVTVYRRSPRMQLYVSNGQKISRAIGVKMLEMYRLHMRQNNPDYRNEKGYTPNFCLDVPLFGDGFQIRLESLGAGSPVVAKGFFDGKDFRVMYLGIGPDHGHPYCEFPAIQEAVHKHFPSE